MRQIICAILFACLWGSGSASAALIQLDQFGIGYVDGTPITGTLTPFDNGGVTVQALTYILPFAGVAGDLILTDPNFSDLPMEVLMFEGDGRVIFFAGNLPNSKAYLSSPPSLDSNNLAFVSDIGPEDTNTASYTPDIGQPGFDISNPTYVIYNGTIGLAPEPGTGAMMLLAVLIGGAIRWQIGRR